MLISRPLLKANKSNFSFKLYTHERSRISPNISETPLCHKLNLLWWHTTSMSWGECNFTNSHSMSLFVKLKIFENISYCLIYLINIHFHMLAFAGTSNRCGEERWCGELEMSVMTHLLQMPSKIPGESRACPSLVPARPLNFSSREWEWNLLWWEMWVVMD